MFVTNWQRWRMSNNQIVNRHQQLEVGEVGSRSASMWASAWNSKEPKKILKWASGMRKVWGTQIEDRVM